ncbi:MAG: extracellular solute-binding protein [Pseudomonadales bacterium]
MKSMLQHTVCVLSLCTALSVSAPIDASEINIYSARQPFLIQPILDQFTRNTGIVTNIVYIKRGLLKRLQREGQRSSADLVLSSDIGPLTQMTALGLTRKVTSPVLSANIPTHFRDPQDNWFGLTSRARLIYIARNSELAARVTSYESLADPALKGRICSRAGSHNYSLSLIASMIHARGERYTQQWLEGLKANLARKPQGNDRAQVKAIQEGVCDIALVNSYYYGKMLNNTRKPEQIKWAKAVSLLYPNQDSRGTHMNISGMALLKNAPHAQQAITLMEYLSDVEAQLSYSDKNYEFPVNPNTPGSDALSIYDKNFKQDNASLAVITSLRNKAIELVTSIGFDD